MKTVMMILAVCLMAACSDPYDALVVQKDDPGFEKFQKSVEELPVEDQKVLVAYMLRGVFAAAVGANAGIPMPAKTIREALADERKWEADQKAKAAAEAAAEAKRKAEEEALRKEEEAKVQKLKEAVSVYVLSKEFVKGDWRTGNIQDAISFQWKAINHSDKPIAGFKGVMAFSDMFGDVITLMNMSVEAPMAPGESYAWSGTTDFNQYNDNLVRLRSLGLKDMKTEWVPEQIVYQ